MMLRSVARGIEKMSWEWGVEVDERRSMRGSDGQVERCCCCCVVGTADNGLVNTFADCENAGLTWLR